MSNVRLLATLLSTRELGSVPILSDQQWREVLDLADRTLCTPLLRGASGAPSWVAEQVQLRLLKTKFRRARLLSTYEEAAHALHSANIDFALLKGFTHEIGFGIGVETRVQSDIDLWCQPQSIDSARAALLAAGFAEHQGSPLSDNHLPPFVKPHNWKWRGDYFDPETPVALELHHSLWSARQDRLPVPGLDEFWNRRVMLRHEHRTIPSLSELDRIGFAALHVLRHVLHDNLRPGHAQELAAMVAHKLNDDRFWTAWRAQFPARTLELQVIAFRLASQWFDQPFPPQILEIAAALPRPVQRWLRRYAWSPITNLETPNKLGLGLHLVLLAGVRDKAAVARRRMIPLRWPKPAEAVNIPYPVLLAQRAKFHALALGRTIAAGARGSADAAAPIASDTSD